MVKPSKLAAAWDVDVHLVYQWAREGRLPFVRVGERAMRIPLDAVHEFERERTGVAHPKAARLEVVTP